MSRARPTAWLLAGLVLATPAPAQGQEKSRDELRGTRDRTTVKLGGYFVGFDTAIRADTVLGGLGTVVDFEKTLGLDNGLDVIRGEVSFRFNSRHTLNVSHWGSRRSGVIILDEEIEFPDETFPIGALVESGVELDLTQVSYRYSFVNSGRVDVAFVFGIGLANVDAGLAALADTGGLTQSIEEEVSVLIPIPMIGFYNELTLARRLFLRYEMDFITVSYDRYDGSIIVFDVELEYFLTKHWGLGVGYTFTDIDFRVDGKDSDDLDFKFESKVDGLQVFASFGFGGTPAGGSR